MGMVMTMGIQLTDKEWFAYTMALLVGGRISIPTKSGKKTGGSSYVITEPKKLGAKDSISVHCGVVKGVRGGIVKVPIYVSNNNILENGVGLAGFLVDLRFDPTLLVYQGVEQGLWEGSLSVDDGKIGQGIFRSSGYRGKEQGNTLDSILLFHMVFKVDESVDWAVRGIPLKLVGSPGSGIGTELLIIRPEYDGYMYITPTGIYSGEVALGDVTYPPITGYLPGGDGVLVGGGNSSTFVDFSLDGLEVIGVGGLGSGVIGGQLVVYVGGKAVGSYPLEFVVGEKNSFKGRLKLILPPGVSYEDIEFRLELEPEDDVPYYIFIPAFGFDVRIVTEVDDSDLKDVTAPPIILKLVEMVVIQDIFASETYTSTRDVISSFGVTDVLEVLLDKVKPNPDNKEVDNIVNMLVIEDIVSIDSNGVKDSSNVEDIGLESVVNSLRLGYVNYDRNIGEYTVNDLILVEQKSLPTEGLDTLLEELGYEDMVVIDTRDSSDNGIASGVGLADEFSIGMHGAKEEYVESLVSSIDIYQIDFE